MNIPNICDLGLSFSLDGFTTLYVALSSFAWIMALLFAPRYMSHDKRKGRFYIFSVITWIATVMVFMAGDLFTLFLFFEMMSLASYVWVAQEEKKKCMEAAGTYLAVAVIGGLVLLMGIVLLYTNVGTLNIKELREACENGGLYGDKRMLAAALCMFFGFAAKAGAFPIHIWLPKAHPVAPAPASALLSGVLTKTGIYGIMIVSFSLFPENNSWGNFVLIIGLITMVLGAVLALFSIDIKRTLACSSVSQIGFILTGIGASVLLGEEGTLADTGTVYHMVNHTVVKLVVFLVAGVIYQNTHSLDLNKIRGFGRKKPFLMVSFLLGGLSLAGVPGFLGYLSKTALHEALVEATEHLGTGLAKGIEWTFLISGGLTLCYMTKLFVCVFVEKNNDTETQIRYEETKDYINFPQRFALIVPALMLLGLGIAIAAKDGFEFMAFHMMKGSLISITIGILLYAILVRKVFIKKDYLNLWPSKLDLENLIYRPIILHFLPVFVGFFMRIMDKAVDSIIMVLRATVYSDKKLDGEIIEGSWFTHKIGHALDVATANRNNEEDVTYNYEHKLAIKLAADRETVSATKRSLSYGLILACAGMFIILGFILYLVFIK